MASRTLARARIKGLTPVELLGKSSVSAKSDADVLVFTVSDRHPSVARRLATQYARAYVSYRADLDTAAITRARAACSRG